jgi:predicted transcriptional regulator
MGGGDMPTPGQMKAARALLEWTGEDLAREAGVSLITVRRAESADADPRALAYRAIVRALEDAGIVWLGSSGIDLRPKP